VFGCGDDRDKEAKVIYLAAFFFFFFFLPPSSPPSSGAAASPEASSLASAFSYHSITLNIQGHEKCIASNLTSSFFSSPPPATNRPQTALPLRNPSSSISNSPKISSTSAAENLSPNLVRAHLNFSALILRSSSS